MSRRATSLETARNSWVEVDACRKMPSLWRTRGWLTICTAMKVLLRIRISICFTKIKSRKPRRLSGSCQGSGAVRQGPSVAKKNAGLGGAAFRSDFFEHILPVAQAQALAVAQLHFAPGVGPAGDKNVRSAVESGIQPGRGIDHVQTGLVQSHRVGGGQQAHVGHQGQVAPAHAVAVRGHVEHKVDVTDALAPALDRAVGVFGKAFHKGDHFCGPVQADGLDRAKLSQLEKFLTKLV